MRIKLNSILVDDQAKALQFYTEILGFVKKHDLPVGEFRWLTVVSPEARAAGCDEVELVLEPNANPAARDYQRALFEQGIPLTALAVDDVAREANRLRALGVRFTVEPTEVGPTTIAIFDDTCGNLIQIYQG